MTCKLLQPATAHTDKAEIYSRKELEHIIRTAVVQQQALSTSPTSGPRR